jgi:hypothetical protein
MWPFRRKLRNPVRGSIEPGITLPVLVDRDDPPRIEVVLEAVTTIDERAAAAQEAALAEARARRDD